MKSREEKWSIKEEGEIRLLFLYLHLYLHSLYLAAFPPLYPFNHAVVLDGRSKARYHMYVAKDAI